MIKGKLESVRCVLGVAVAGVLLALVVGAAPAFAEVECVGGCASWLHFETQFIPGTLPRGGEGEILLPGENLGDTGLKSSFAVTDKLPKGLTAQSVRFTIGGESGVFGSSFGKLFCQVVPEEVTCTGPQELVESNVGPFETVEVAIKVRVSEAAQSGEENTVSVVGGGAPGAPVSTPIAVGSAPTPFGVEQYELRAENADGSSDTQAGSHPFQLTTDIELNQSVHPFKPPAAVKDLHFDLPPGLIGNPTPFPQCPLDKFLDFIIEASNLCPDDTVVGVASVTVALPLGEEEKYQTFTVPLFALVPSVGEPARFGFAVNGDPVYLTTSVRTGGDYGVTVDVNNITEVIGFASSQVTFWGVPGDPRHDSVRGWNCLSGKYGLPPCAATEEHSPPPLLTMPTSCTGPVRASVEADSWQEEGAFTPPLQYTFKDNLGRPVGMDGCNQEPFTPSIRVTPDGQAGSTPTGLTVDEHVPQETSLNPEGLAESDVKGLSVTLPEGVAINPAGADGLLACSTEAIGAAERRGGRVPGSSEARDGEDQDTAATEPLGRRGVPRDTEHQPVREPGRAVCRSVRPGVGDSCEGDGGSVGEPGDGPVDDAF